MRILALLLLTAGCATSASAPADLFTAPERHLGKTVRVGGYLSFGADGQNLAPTWQRDRDRAAGRCLPVKAATPEVYDAARLFNGAFAVVEGKVERLLEQRPDRFAMNFAWCKEVGVRATRISWR